MDDRHDGPHAGSEPTLLLMVGLPASGKTTRARALAIERSALLLTPDAWALTLFGQEDRHQERPNGKRWLLEGLLINVAVDTLRLQRNAILDFGLWSREERWALRWLAAAAGATSEIVYLPIERDEQWRRIQNRWASDPQHTFPMEESELDAWQEAFQIPDAGELTATSVSAPPRGDSSWLTWARRHWPSVAAPK